VHRWLTAVSPCSRPFCCCRYEKEGNIFDEDFTEFSSRERMHKWDRQWAYLKYLPQVG
jgi:hypothetical protein